MSAGYLFDSGGGRIPFLSQTARGTMEAAMRMPLDFCVQGNDARDLITDTPLVQVAPALANQTTTALLDGEPPPATVTTALTMSGGGSWDAWDSTVNDITTGSALLALTFFLQAAPVGSANLVGKRDGVAGMELFVDANQQVSCQLNVSGGALRSIKLPGTFDVGRWHTVVCHIDRSVPGGLGGGQLILAGTNESASRAANRIAIDIDPGSLSNASTWAVGAQRIGVSANMRVLQVAIGEGPKTEGRKATIIAGEVAKVTWADQVYGGITP